MITITTTVEPRGPAAAIVLTDEQVAVLGGASVPVTVTIDTVTARLRVARMGGENLIGLSKAVRAEFGIAAGDEVTATIAPDLAERTVEVPDVLAKALELRGLTSAFNAQSYTKRKEAARQIVEAKQDATRQRRIDAILAKLRDQP